MMQTKTIDNKEKICVLRSPSQFWLYSMTSMPAEVEVHQPRERPPRKRMKGQKRKEGKMGATLEEKKLLDLEDKVSLRGMNVTEVT